MFRKQIIKKHLNVGDIHYVIGHHGSVFFPMTIRTILLLLALYFVYLLLDKYIQRDYTKRIFAVIGIGIFVKYIYDFMGFYLDGIVLSDKGINFFMWQGIADYKVDFFDWTKIETVNYSQNSIWDKIYSRGNISIKLHEIEFPFDNVSFPKKQADKIIKMKILNESKLDESKNVVNLDGEKVSVLAEALGEVIKEYMQKSPKNKEESD